MIWSVWSIKPGKERAVAIELGRRGFLPFVPVLPFKYRQGNRYWRPVALTGYTLVQVDSLTPKVQRCIRAADFRNGDKCVHRLVGQASPKELLAFLEYIQSLKEPSSVKHSVKPGDKVSLQDGRIQGTVASVEDKNVNILIGLFNSIRIVTVKHDAIQLENDNTSPSISLPKAANQGTTIRRDGGRSSAAGGQSRL